MPTPLHFLFMRQRWCFTHSIDLTPARFELGLSGCRKHVEYFSHYGPQKENLTVFDLGTGWNPIVPVGLFCCGAQKVLTCDIVPLIDKKRTHKLLRLFVDYYDRGDLQQHLPLLVPERIEVLREALRLGPYACPKALLARAGTQVMVTDAGRTGLADHSIDYIVSIGTLLHIPETILVSILAEFKRIGTPDCLLSIAIDMADLFSYFDHRISQLNFLRFSDTMWRIINNRVIPMNRLRITDYRELLRQAGFKILEEKNDLVSLEDLHRIPLAPRFHRYSDDDLRIWHTWMMAAAADRLR